ncbi:unnamed protein product [Rhizophagus irregularis]|nr:unnamed protein product [Rhizophagus irregularis]
MEAEDEVDQSPQSLKRSLHYHTYSINPIMEVVNEELYMSPKTRSWSKISTPSDEYNLFIDDIHFDAIKEMSKGVVELSQSQTRTIKDLSSVMQQQRS